jgi:dTDP-4-amino-4,6-dideoxygalactose transaminase
MYKHEQKAALRDIGVNGISQPVLRSVSDQRKNTSGVYNMKTPPDVYTAEPIPSAAESEIKAILESGDLFRYTATEGSPVAKLEKEFADFIGVSFALAVNSCSSALLLSMRALGLAPGSLVVIPAFTFSAVPSAVVHANCVPVLVNVGKNYRIDIDDFHQKLDGNIAAVLISHMRGHTSDMDIILDACQKQDIPIIEDAAHSLGTTWSGRNIGTLGRVGCFSFQSYKLLNAGEGGMLITDDADLIARAIIMSGAYEHNWKKHPVVRDRFAYWQNRVPLYNFRMNNLSAAVLRPQIAEIPSRAQYGRANHDHVAAILNSSPWFDVPQPLPPELRAPDSIQFNLVDFDTDEEAKSFQDRAQAKGVKVEIFGLSEDNARSFWNWKFIEDQGDLSMTRDMLMRACDVRLPVRISREDLDFIATALVETANETKVSLKSTS